MMVKYYAIQLNNIITTIFKISIKKRPWGWSEPLNPPRNVTDSENESILVILSHIPDTYLLTTRLTRVRLFCIYYNVLQ